ncbi:hypothetical protein [Nostoc sp.]
MGSGEWGVVLNISYMYEWEMDEERMGSGEWGVGSGEWGVGNMN